MAVAIYVAQERIDAINGEEFPDFLEKMSGEASDCATGCWVMAEAHEFDVVGSVMLEVGKFLFPLPGSAGGAGLVSWTHGVAAAARPGRAVVSRTLGIHLPFVQTALTPGSRLCWAATAFVGRSQKPGAARIPCVGR